MAVLSGATASGKQLYQNFVPTAATSVYTAPNATSNVTSPSATAYIKEIILCNTTGTAATVSVMVGANSAQNAIIYGQSITGNDTKILSGLNTMVPAGGVVWIVGNTASAISITISGVEVQ